MQKLTKSILKLENGTATKADRDIVVKGITGNQSRELALQDAMTAVYGIPFGATNPHTIMEDLINAGHLARTDEELTYSHEDKQAQVVKTLLENGIHEFSIIARVRPKQIYINVTQPIKWKAVEEVYNNHISTLYNVDKTSSSFEVINTDDRNRHICMYVLFKD